MAGLEQFAGRSDQTLPNRVDQLAALEERVRNLEQQRAEELMTQPAEEPMMPPNEEASATEPETADAVDVEISTGEVVQAGEEGANVIEVDDQRQSREESFFLLLKQETLEWPWRRSTILSKAGSVGPSGRSAFAHH